MTIYRNISSIAIQTVRYRNIASSAVATTRTVNGQAPGQTATPNATVSFAGAVVATGGSGLMSRAAGAIALAGAATDTVHVTGATPAGAVAFAGAGMGNIHAAAAAAGSVALAGTGVAGVKIAKTGAGTVAFAGSVSATVAGYKAAVLADNPLGYWRLLETSGTTAVDSSGNGHNGTYTGTFTLGATSPITHDATAKALNLTSCTTSVNGYVSIPDATALNPTGTALTIECWLKFKTASTGTNPFAGYVFKTNAGGTAQWGLGAGNSPTNNELATMHVYTSTDSSGTSAYSGAIDDGAWHHVVGVYNGTNLVMYRDGSNTFSTNYNQTGTILSATGEPLYIGNIFGALVAQFDGYICEAAVYGTALSSARILAHFNAA